MTKRSVLLRNVLMFLFLFFFVVPPAGITVIGEPGYIINSPFFGNDVIRFITTDLIFKGRNLFAFLFICYTVVSKIYKKSLIFHEHSSKAIGFFALFCTWLITSTAINDADTYSVLVASICDIGLSLYICSEIKRDARLFFKTYQLVLLIQLAINLIEMLINPMGIATGTDNLSTRYFISGTKNETTPYLILACLILLIQFEMSSNAKYLFVGTLLVLLNITIMGSSTGLVGVIVLFAIYGIVSLARILKGASNRKITRGRLIKALLIFAIIVFIGITFFDLLNNLNWLVSDLLNKDVTLSGRTAIWEEAERQFTEKAIVGYGFGHMVTGHFYAHNLLLELLLVSGAVGSILYLIFIATVLFSGFLKGETRIDLVLSTTMIAVIIISISEAFILNIAILVCLIIASDRNNIVSVANTTRSR